MDQTYSCSSGSIELVGGPFLIIAGGFVRGRGVYGRWKCCRGFRSEERRQNDFDPVDFKCDLMLGGWGMWALTNTK